MRTPTRIFVFLSLIISLFVAAAFPAETVSSTPASKSMAAVLQPLVDSHALAGAVTLVATKDKVLSLEAVGYADVDARRPMRTDNLFWIASMSKPMTATAVMMLVDEGKINLDDPVEKYLPEFKGQWVIAEQNGDHMLLKKPSHPITVRNVLSHTSGLPFLSPAEKKIDSYSLRESAVTYALSPLKFQPDTKYLYSNEGINTAARILEVVSGAAYEEFIDTRLFKPLGMKDTTFWPNEEQARRVAKSYKPNADKTGLKEIPIHYLTYPLTDRRRGPCPAGGLFSTAADVSLFCRMILSGGVYQGKRYLSEKSLREMTSTQTGKLLSKNGDASGYGLGWGTSRALHGPSDPVLVGPCGHGGAFSTDMWIDPEHNLITVFMVQHEGFGPGGPRALPNFKKAALEAFGK
jgi:CubicO group peptidase (beta-lactamase class C family)